MEKSSKTTNQLFIENSIADNLPSMVKNELTKLSAVKQEEFVEEYKRKSKSTGILYVLMFILPLQYGSFKKWGLQVVFWITGGALGVWWLIDMFRIPNMVKDYNKDVALEVMRNLKATA